MESIVVFVSCAEKAPECLIKEILGELSTSVEEENEIVSYPWCINTKYYEADVRLCVLKDKLKNSDSFISRVQGIVIYFDSESEDSVKSANDWILYFDEYEAEVKLLVCNSLQECNINDKGYEVVELTEDDLGMGGVSRINQALEAHVWPELRLKSKKDPTNIAGLWHGGKLESTDAEVEDEAFGGNHEPDDLGDFSQLFGQLATMKDRANNLHDDERKSFAEQVVFAYWKAIGGDDSEILDC